MVQLALMILAFRLISYALRVCCAIRFEIECSSAVRPARIKVREPCRAIKHTGQQSDERMLGSEDLGVYSCPSRRRLY